MGTGDVWGLKGVYELVGGVEGDILGVVHFYME